jgi:hypothetical protein
VDTLMGGVGTDDSSEPLTLILAAAHDRSLTLHALHPRRPEDEDDYGKEEQVVAVIDDEEDPMDLDVGAGPHTRRRREQPHRAARNVPRATLALAGTSSARPLPYELTSLATGDFRAPHRRARATRDPSAMYAADDGGGSATAGFLLGDIDAVGTSPTGAAVHIGVIRGAHARALRFVAAVLARLGSVGSGTRRGDECKRCTGAASDFGGADKMKTEGGGSDVEDVCVCANRLIAWWEPARPLCEAWRDGAAEGEEEGERGVGEAVNVDMLCPLPYGAGAPAGVGPGAVWLEGKLREGRKHMGHEVRVVCGQMERDLGVNDWVGEVVTLWRLAVGEVF